MTTKTILVLDDDELVGELIAAAAESLGIHCILTSDADTFLAAITPDLSMLFLDLLMPQLDGIEVLRLLSQREHTPPIVLMSGVGKRVIGTAQTLATSLGLNIAGLLEKPFRLQQLEALLTAPRQTAPQRSGRKLPLLLSRLELQYALARDQFVVHYQPQVDIPTGRVIGVEALVRWQHPTLDLIFPDDFIPLCEDLELIDDLGWLVARHSLADLLAFHATHAEPLTLSLNVSVQSLRDLNFPDRFLALVQQHNIAPERVILEITESGLIQELSRTLDVLTRLRIKGLQLSIDDFGTGYSMLKQLQHTPATEIKIDKSFVQRIFENDSDRVMVQKTIEIGHELGMKVLAEGVETQQQLDYLRDQGCDYAQGYFFSKPLAPPALEKWLASYSPKAS